jgi:hypothetical protein
MVRIEQLAEAALAGEALKLRSLTQDFLSQCTRLADCPVPVSTDANVLAVCAGLIELLAHRRGEPPPPWAVKIGPVQSPLYLVSAAGTMSNLRRLCETESPPPLKRRHLFAPPTFLEFV